VWLRAVSYTNKSMVLRIIQSATAASPKVGSFSPTIISVDSFSLPSLSEFSDLFLVSTIHPLIHSHSPPSLIDLCGGGSFSSCLNNVSERKKQAPNKYSKASQSYLYGVLLALRCEGGMLHSTWYQQ
jgi:hypothetical protein